MNEVLLLEYCWKHKLFSDEMKTKDGDSIEVIDTGLYDRHRMVFFNAKIRIDGLLLVGNVKMLLRSAHWRLHSYDCNTKYENVILVVCYMYDEAIAHCNGIHIPVLCPKVPEKIRKNFEVLMSDKGMVQCHRNINGFSSVLTRHAWLAAMQTEHLEEESNRVREYFNKNHDWQSAFEKQLFRAFGLGVNEDVMEELYLSLPKSFLISNHVDDLFQIEAVLFGQAGLLELDAVPEKYQDRALNEGYLAKLRNEWLYLSHKYSLQRPSRFWFYIWKPYGRGCHATPHVLLSSLANLIYMRKVSVGQVIDSENEKDIFSLIATHATPYWFTHSQFGKMTERSEKHLSKNRQSRIALTCHIPFLFAYGREMDEVKCDMAFDIMEQMKGYRTPEIAWFERFGIKADGAGATVALCQLKNQYCDKRDCMRCRFGYEFVKKYDVNN